MNKLEAIDIYILFSPIVGEIVFKVEGMNTETKEYFEKQYDLKEFKETFPEASAKLVEFMGED
jgi:hypothetical protein